MSVVGKRRRKSPDEDNIESIVGVACDAGVACSGFRRRDYAFLRPDA